MKRLALGLMGLLIVGLIAGFNWGLPTLELGVPSVLYDINGQEITKLNPENIAQADLNEISDYVEKAVIATEDQNFYSHHGLDFKAIARAVWVNLTAGEVKEGGSTITQQTAKNLYLSQERTIWRKLKELVYTLALEKRYSKDEILAMYLNSIYYGQGATGIEAAAQTYFGKSARDLSLAESTILVGIPRRPAYYDPYRYPDHAKTRQKVILKQMVDESMITSEEAEQAEKVPLVYGKSSNLQGDAPYFSQMVADYLVEKYGAPLVFGGGLKVYSTLDLNMQQAAQSAYNAVMMEQKPDLQAALAAVDPATGHIRAMIGGRDFRTAPFNRAVDSKRQPGSAFKPFLYSKALEMGFTEADMLMCEPVTFTQKGTSDYTPRDYGDEGYHYRSFTLKEAIMVSDNVVSVRLNEAIGPENTAEHARRFGFEGPIKPYLSLALGTSEVSPLEMASAYGVFANQGRLMPPLAVIKVLNDDGTVLESNQVQAQTAVSAENAYIVTDMLMGVMQSGGTGSHLAGQVGRTSAGKTGTTQEYRDAWFVGYTPELSCAVWVGYDSPTQSVGAPGGRISGPIWSRFMHQALADYPSREFSAPENITRINMCLDSGMIATENCPRSLSGAFISGTEPQDLCIEHRSFFDWRWEWRIPNDSGNEEREDIKENDNRPKQERDWMRWLPGQRRR
ncbi:MAG: PBP1A family penicillin-binding protein [Syntrophomonadaceae bacterium]|nr:PBP1A family penicillin-binding protein [Syntrophomonadaceae bacterium]